ncbi:flavohemo protein [Xylariaceae sp. FL0662B]|nr:flavohemo protein [Xylariaceae sp. FL0662B]
MVAPLSPAHIAIVKATAPVLKEHGVTITSLFYKNMMTAHPELKNIFSQVNQATGTQPRSLAASVYAYANYVDDLSKLTAAVERIAHKHVSLTILPEQYAIVGKYLLEAVATVLGDACTPEIGEAWTAAYAVLADILINREQELYASWGNWTGWRRFKIQRKVPESAAITSFYLVPEDREPLPLFLPGQYVSLHMYIPQLNLMQPRQYSLSGAPRSDYYRISVKRDTGKKIGTPGLISNLLHDNYKEGDIVQLTHPTGEFFVDPKADNKGPLALISAGVGLTPMISILDSTVETNPQRQVAWIHGAHSSEVRAFKDHIQGVCEKNSNVKPTFFLSNTQEKDVQGVDYHFQGRMDLDKLDPKANLFLDNPDAEYYICGPYAFMTNIQNYLVKAGVDEKRIHLEVFGTGNE